MENGAVEPDKQIYTMEQFEADVEKIAQMIKASGRKFTHIHTLPRGGWPLAAWLGNRLGLNAVVELKNYYSAFGHDRKMIPREFKEISPGIWSNVEIPRENVLVVDDIADTGKQLRPYHDAGFFIATLFYKKWSAVVPDIWLNEKSDKWIVFPWEKEPL